MDQRSSRGSIFTHDLIVVRSLRSVNVQLKTSRRSQFLRTRIAVDGTSGYYYLAWVEQQNEREIKAKEFLVRQRSSGRFCRRSRFGIACLAPKKIGRSVARLGDILHAHWAPVTGARCIRIFEEEERLDDEWWRSRQTSSLVILLARHPFFHVVARRELAPSSLACMRVWILPWLPSIMLQIPLVITAKTQTPATRSCRPDIATVVAVTDIVVPQTIVIVVIIVSIAIAAMMHHYDIFGDGNGSGGLVDDGGSGEQAALVVDNTNGSPTILYSNARRFAAWFHGFVVADSLATALGRRWWCTAVLWSGYWRLHTILHVMCQSGGQRTRIELVEFDQLQQVVKFRRSLVEGIQPTITALVKDLKGTNGSTWVCWRADALPSNAWSLEDTAESSKILHVAHLKLG